MKSSGTIEARKTAVVVCEVSQPFKVAKVEGSGEGLKVERVSIGGTNYMPFRMGFATALKVLQGAAPTLPAGKVELQINNPTTAAIAYTLTVE